MLFSGSVMRLSLIAALCFFLAACGGSSDSPADNSKQQTGSFGVLITDGPTDDFQQVNLTVTQIELLSDDNRRVTTFSGSKTFNLLDLENTTELFSISDAPVGAYNKIRLTLEEIELVLEDGSSVFPNLPGNGKVDLNPRGTFFIESDATLLVELDFDAEKSIKVTKTGNVEKYQFRPIVFVKIVRAALDTKLIRLTGTINKLDLAGTGSFELCDLQSQSKILRYSDNSDAYCVKVKSNLKTSFFDVNGDPSVLENLSDDDQATVMGRFRITDEDDDSSSDDDSNSDDLSSDDDDSSDDDQYTKLVLMADVVMAFDASTHKGISRSEVGNNPESGESVFDFEPADDAQALVQVVLQEGTRIYSRAGIELSAEDIKADLLTQVDGVVSVDAIKAAVVVIKQQDLSTQLSGIISSVTDDYLSMQVITAPDSEDRCVDISKAKVYLAQVDEDGYIVMEEKYAHDLESGQRVDAFGDEKADGCLKAMTVIYQQEETPVVNSQ